MNVDEIEIDDIGADIEAAMSELPKEEEVQEDDILETPEEKPDRARDETGKFAKKPEEKIIEPPIDDPSQQIVSKIEPPVSLPANVKAKWEKLDPDVQQYWAEREANIHKNMTAQDGDLRIGRDMKEVITPFAPMFQHMGVQPRELIGDALHKIHILNTGNPHQKVQLLHQLAQQYGVDLANTQPDPVDPNYQRLEQEIQGLRRIASPEAIEKQLQERILADRVNSEVEAFSSDPKNVHFEQVKTVMGSLLTSGAAKDLNTAYDMACNADPSIRSTLQQVANAAQAEKRKAEIEAKKRAGASVNGSPAKASPATKAPTHNDDIGADIEAAFGELDGRI